MRGRKKKVVVKTDKRKIKSKKQVIDGIEFKSKLEAYMYTCLKREKIPTTYEGEVYTLMGGFYFGLKSYERQSNAKGDMVDRGNKKIRGITYKPDFVGDGYIIECKGFANESFSLRWKLFKKHLVGVGLDVLLFKPQKRTECEEVAKIIKEKLFKNK